MQITGAARDEDQVQIGMRANAARSMYVALSDLKVKVAQLFNVLPAASNVSNAQAQVSLTGAVTTALPEIAATLANNAHPSAATIVQTSLTQALMQVPAGTSELNLLLADPGRNTAELQIFTKDGRHLFGEALTAAQQQIAVSSTNGFVANATYSSRYLNDGVTEIRVAAEDLSTTNGSLTINGVVISAANPVPPAQDLATLVNTQTVNTDVQATIDAVDGAFVLKNVAGKEGNPITLGALSGVLTTVSGTVAPDRYLICHGRQAKSLSQQLKYWPTALRNFAEKQKLKVRPYRLWLPELSDYCRRRTEPKRQSAERANLASGSGVNQCRCRRLVANQH